MIVTLSNHWKITKIILYILMFFYLLFGIGIFSSICTEPLNEDDILLYIFLFILLGVVLFTFIYIKKTLVDLLTQKIKFSENKIAMISSKKETACVDLNKETYYEILHLIVGRCNSQNFIIISNESFESYDKINGLGKLCKVLHKDKTKIIAPYNETTFPFLNIDEWRNCKTNKQL